jgi:hypothetical protein
MDLKTRNKNMLRIEFLARRETLQSRQIYILIFF